MVASPEPYWFLAEGKDVEQIGLESAVRALRSCHEQIEVSWEAPFGDECCSRTCSAVRKEVKVDKTEYRRRSLRQETNTPKLCLSSVSFLCV